VRASSTETLLVGSEEVNTYNDASFKAMREAYGLGLDFLSSIDLHKLEVGGGKGGMMMGFTADKLYIVKELNASDQATMLKIAADLVVHLLHPKGSLLARIFGHFERKGRKYLVMNNWMPPPRYDELDPKLKAVKTSCSQYDLKGCADDKTLSLRGESVKAVHKRIFSVHLWCGTLCWNDTRAHYYEGKTHARKVRFPVTQKVHDEISEKVTRDVTFLQKHQLMDYSLVVSYHAVPKNETMLTKVFEGSSDNGAQPYIGVKNKQATVLYVGIIDFLQDWNFKKVLAQCIKVAERNKATIPPTPYGDRFRDFVKNKFEATCEQLDAEAVTQEEVTEEEHAAL